MATAKEFTAEEWARIRRTLNKDPVGFGLPEQVYGSLVAASFNIRKLGALRPPRARSKEGRDEHTMRFLADVCQHFDLIAVQEVMPEMAAIRRLRELLGDQYGLIVSDVIGTFPGERGNEERLAYLYNRRVVHRGELVTEVSTSRSKVLKTMAEHHKDFYSEMDKDATAKAWRKYRAEMIAAIKAERALPRQPSFKADVDQFVQFIRIPFAASFEVRAQPGAERYGFVAVNAHLHFGRKIDRQNEAAALIEWILGKVRSEEARNIVLLGDLNFDFDNPTSDLARIRARYQQLGGLGSAAGKQVYVSFPFIVPHPRPKQRHPEGKLYRTNIRLSQTYDQIGIFSLDERLGTTLETTPEATHSANEEWSMKPVGPDYGVFNFTDLFSQALLGKPYGDLTKTQRSALVKRYEHKVSDHLPIWYRMPLPRTRSGFPIEV